MRSRDLAASLAMFAVFGLAAPACNQSTPVSKTPVSMRSAARASADKPTGVPSEQPTVVGPHGEIADPIGSPTLATAADSASPVSDSPTEASASPSEGAEAAPHLASRQPKSPRLARRFDDPLAADLVMPKVVLSHGHAQLCLAKVGDRLPDFQLSDLSGQQQSLSQRLGSQLTVVTFWTSAQPSALEQLADLNPDILARFSDYGVAVVGINESDDPQLAAELAQNAGASFPNLSDRDGAALALVASGKLPRTYLIDSALNIVWFDLEYSRTTRRELSQAIRFYLAHGPSASPPAP